MSPEILVLDEPTTFLDPPGRRALAKLLRALPQAQRYAGELAAVNQAAFGLVMVGFLVFEPLGLVGIWRRLQIYLQLWPFRYRPLAGAGK